MSFCPKLKKLKKGIITIHFEDSFPHLKNIIKLTDFQIKKTKKELTLSFKQFSKYCQYNDTYKVTYKHKADEDDLLYLLYLIKYKGKKLYENKNLIMDCIFHPFLCEKYTYDNFTCIENDLKIKKGTYTIDTITLKNIDYYVIGGHIFGLFQKDDFSTRNIIINENDDCITSLISIDKKSNEKIQIITGSKNGAIKLWEVIDFHEVKYKNTVFKKFYDVKNIYKVNDNSYSIIICDENKIKVWKTFNEEIFGFDVDKSQDKENDINTIECTDYYFNTKNNINIFVYADRRKNLFFNTFEKINFLFSVKRHLKTNKIHFDDKRQISTLKFYNDNRTLFIGNSEMINVYNYNTFTIDYAYHLNDKINFIDYYLNKNMLYVFAGGKESFHILHFDK
jgi:hypothetical protein